MTQIQGIKSIHFADFNQKYESTFQSSVTYSQLS